MKGERASLLKLLEQELSYVFQNISLLDQALTHPSFAHEYSHNFLNHNERLEFLGDAVLNFCVSDLLLTKYPRFDEGKLSLLRASLVNERTLGEVALNYHLDRYILLGKGEEKSGGRKKTSILAACLEALIGAIYVDGGINAVSAFVEREFAPLSPEDGKDISFHNYRGELQEIVVKRFRVHPRYFLLGQAGKPHEPVFEMGLSIPGVLRISAKGRNKKEAARRAAKEALKLLQEEKS